jgi:hypothetical protein
MQSQVNCHHFISRTLHNVGDSFGFQLHFWAIVFSNQLHRANRPLHLSVTCMSVASRDERYQFDANQRTPEGSRLALTQAKRHSAQDMARRQSLTYGSSGDGSSLQYHWSSRLPAAGKEEQQGGNGVATPAEIGRDGMERDHRSSPRSRHRAEETVPKVFYPQFSGRITASRGPMTRSQSCHDEDYRGFAPQTLMNATPAPHRHSVQARRGSIDDLVSCSSRHNDDNDDGDDDDDDDGFAWDSSLQGSRVSYRSAASGGSRHCSSSPASLPSADGSRKSAVRHSDSSPLGSPPLVSPCSFASNPDRRSSARMEAALSSFQSWEEGHTLRFSGRSSQHQRNGGTINNSLHSMSSRYSDAMGGESSIAHDEIPPLPTNLSRSLQPPSDDAIINNARGPREIATKPSVADGEKLDHVEEQDKELLRLAIERSKQDFHSGSSHTSLALYPGSVRRTSSSLSTTPSLLNSPSVNVSFSLSEPPPPAPSESFHGIERITPSSAGGFRHSSSSRGSGASRPGGGGHLMGPEDYSRSEDEEQRMLNLALERSLYIPESPSR